MKLLTKTIEKELPALYATDGKRGNRKVLAKFFTPDAHWTWYVLEGERKGNDFLFFGLVDSGEPELGYFSLNELKSVRGPLGLTVERDRYFSARLLSEIAPEFCERLWGDSN